VVVQLIVSAHANSVVEGLLWKGGCPGVCMVSFCGGEFFFDRGGNAFAAN